MSSEVGPEVPSSATLWHSELRCVPSRCHSKVEASVVIAQPCRKVLGACRLVSDPFSCRLTFQSLQFALSRLCTVTV